MRRKQSTRVALGGISASLALTLLFLSSLFPFALYAVPAMAGIALLPIGIELGLSVAGVSYAAVALLGLLILPDREVACLLYTSIRQPGKNLAQRGAVGAHPPD